MSKLTTDRFKASEYEFNVWVATTEIGTTNKDIQDPAYWAHVAAKLRPWDIIVARADDGSWISFLLVLACDRQWAKTFVLGEHSLTTADVSASQNSAYEVKWHGPHSKFVVIRRSDKAVVKEGLALRNDADAWVLEHQKVMA